MGDAAHGADRLGRPRRVSSGQGPRDPRGTMTHKPSGPQRAGAGLTRPAEHRLSGGRTMDRRQPAGYARVPGLVYLARLRRPQAYCHTYSRSVSSRWCFFDLHGFRLILPFSPREYVGFVKRYFSVAGDRCLLERRAHITGPSDPHDSRYVGTARVQGARSVDRREEVRECGFDSFKLEPESFGEKPLRDDIPPVQRQLRIGLQDQRCAKLHHP